MPLFSFFGKKKLRKKTQTTYLCRELKKSIGLTFKQRLQIQEKLDKLNENPAESRSTAEFAEEFPQAGDMRRDE
jgi:uncharacterized protein YlaI